MKYDNQCVLCCYLSFIVWRYEAALTAQHASGCLDGRIFPDREGQCWKGLLLEGELRHRGSQFVNSSLSVRMARRRVSKKGAGHESLYCVLAIHENLDVWGADEIPRRCVWLRGGR